MLDKAAGSFAQAWIAHSRNANGHRHDLVRHLVDVGEKAAEFGAKFGAAELARIAGLWHDLGKFHPDFQNYLYRCELESVGERRGPDHKAAGSSLAKEQIGWFLAMIVAGHHGGLQDKDGDGGFEAWLCEKQAEPGQGDARFREALAIARRHLSDMDAGCAAAATEYRRLQAAWEKTSAKRQLELLMRMVFSCLVDADFLDTERHFQPAVPAERQSVPLSDLWAAFQAYHRRLETAAHASAAVLGVRREVYESCLSAAEQPRGFFRLTVPTGGGKTLSGLAFGLRHALHHDLDRVIFAVPYTSICEQTTAAYRDVFGDGPVVLEHHSAAGMPDEESENPATAADVWTRLASQNWDAPVVVTTTVQLLESLLGRRTSRCRKLHNVARSVIVLDEAQTLPAHLLDPALDVLKELVRAYGVTVVLCTATQPALDSMLGGVALDGIREIVPAHPRHFRALRRVEYEWPAEPWDWDRVAEELARSPQGLAILNTRQAAQEVAKALPPGVTPLHLSTQLCGAHRLAALRLVRQRLADGLPCRLVATQVVEAGVDLDFPLVLRAAGPLDRIVQAAGRCNRAGLSADLGRVVVFRPAEHKLPPGDYRKAAELTEILRREGVVDLDDPALFLSYFDRFYKLIDRDRRKVQGLRESWSFKQVAREARVIEDDTCPVLVPYAGYERALDGLRSNSLPPRLAWRHAQPFSVGLRWYELQRAQAGRLVEKLVDRDIWLWNGPYDETFGLDLAAIRDLNSADLAERGDWA